MADSPQAAGEPRTGPMASRLGIVAGGGGLPRRLVEACRAAGREVFVLALEGAAEPETVEGVAHAWCRLGAAARGLALLRENNVTELVLAGGVRRPSLVMLRPDWRAAKLFARIGYRALGDDGLLSAVVGELEREGFRVIGADQLLDGRRGGWRRRACSASAAPMPQAHGRHRARAARRAGIGRARYRPGGRRPAGAGARRRGDRGHRRAVAPLRRAAPRGAGRGARQGREAGPGAARRPADDRAANRRRSPPRPGCAASPSRPGRRSCSTATRSSMPPTAPGSLSSASARRDRIDGDSAARAVHLHRRRRALGRCARRRR